ncbi:secretin and TonB N-terminal domain-containing protein [Aphanothece sacrum]|uniref:General secretion pathway protein D n=1 Tax=Aphanothece sacrum FPU1 TaxID=1920663 RepID=A0A401ICT7_APHSA|nr:general secretion pathway protein D [Aphanothece sacrum FPU1]GBF85155.1 general secretion pathway protein D [Aphanothece sacrum FPU3]
MLTLLSSQPSMALNNSGSEETTQKIKSETELSLEEIPGISPRTTDSEITTNGFKITENPSLYAQIPAYPPGYSAPPPTYQPQGSPVTPGPRPEILVPNPEVIIKSNGTSIPESLQPTMPVAPTLPRAIAPPVGDMAISNINAGADSIDLGSSAIVPRLVLRQAPAREVLAVLARYAGMNLVFTDEAPQAAPGGAPGGAGTGEATVSLDLENEPVEQVFNSVLMISGLKANRRGRTIFVGSQLPQAARNLVSRTIRLNQVKSSNAGVFLATQGAEFQRLITKTEDIIDPLTQRVIGKRELPGQLEALQPKQAEGSTAPMLLGGLTVSSDDRLNTITLVGEPRNVQVATSLLTQMDARRRQVAVNVKVVDVTLTNDQSFSSSFSFGSGDAFIVQDNGAAVLRFGGTSPVNGAEINGAPGRVSNPPAIINPFGPLGDSPANTFIDFNNTITAPGLGEFIFQRAAGISQNPRLTGITDFIPGGTATAALPSYFQYPKKFLSQIETNIQSGNAKVLTDPTLVVQEGQEATVKLTQKVVENVNTQVDPLSGVRTTTPVLQDAGLTLSINIDKIDDNGFINLSVSPTIAAPGSQVQFDSGQGAINTLTLLMRRELTSGLIRLRDGQTLILSGIISELDRSTSSKVPLLGDIPVLGALFRSQTDTTERTEVIVLLTPQILHDNGQWGYNYQPGRGTAEVLRNQGFPVQVVP